MLNLINEKKDSLYSYKDILFFSDEFFFLSIKKVKGIGERRAKNICASIGLKQTIKIFELNDFFFLLFSSILNEFYGTELFLIRLRENRFRLLTSIAPNSYRVLKYSLGLPINGQRTRSNAKTSKNRDKRRKIRLKSYVKKK
jgi:small subunit ribosomal protein S13